MRASDPNRPATVAAGWQTAELWVLFGITALAAALRLFRVEQWSMAAAEVATWQAVTMPLAGEGGFFASAAGQQPLVHLVLRWLLDAGVLPFHGEGWLRLPFVFCGTISVPLLALAAGLVASPRTALLAAGLLAVHPWHLAMSQTAAPPVVAIVGTLVAVIAALAARPRGRRWRLLVAGLAAALACASHRAGLGTVGMLLAGHAAVAWRGAAGRHRVLPGLGFAVAALAPALLFVARAWPFEVVSSGDEVSPWWSCALAPTVPVVLLALVAPSIVRPLPVTAMAAASVPALALALLAAAGGPVAVDDLSVLLVPLLVLAAGAAIGTAAQVRAAAAGAATWVGAATVPAAAATWLLVASLLHSTVYAGHRSPWRDAADLALDATTGGRGLVVAARYGSASLGYYLRPNHWREPDGDPHPGIRCDALAGAWSHALRELFAAAADRPVFVVLRRDEFEALQAEAEAEALLRGACSLAKVLPCPREHGDGTLYVFRSRGAD